MKLVILLVGLLILAGRADAQLLSFNPEQIVSLRLIHGENLLGRIIDADARQLHLVGPKVNRLVPFSLLHEDSRKEFNLVPDQPSEKAPITEFLGLNSSRRLLKESQEDLAASSCQPGLLPIRAYHLSYPLYPVFYGYPCPAFKNSGFSADIRISF